jgi:hypothetical protein
VLSAKRLIALGFAVSCLQGVAGLTAGSVGFPTRWLVVGAGAQTCHRRQTFEPRLWPVLGKPRPGSSLQRTNHYIAADPTTGHQQQHCPKGLGAFAPLKSHMCPPQPHVLDLFRQVQVSALVPNRLPSIPFPQQRIHNSKTYSSVALGSVSPCKQTSGLGPVENHSDNRKTESLSSSTLGSRSSTIESGRVSETRVCGEGPRHRGGTPYRARASRAKSRRTAA